MFDLPTEPAEIPPSPPYVQEWHIPIHTIAKEQLATMSDRELDRDWKLSDFFGTIAVINLPHATERLTRVKRHLHRIGTDEFTVFAAIYGRTELDASIWKKIRGNRDGIDSHSKKGREALDRLHQGEAGCYMSHYKLLQNVRNSFKEALAELQAAQDDEAIKSATAKVRKYSRVLIFEDDVGFGLVNKQKTAATKKGAGKLLRKALKNLPENWDMLYLIVNATEPTKAVTPHLRKMKRSWCAAAYAVNYTMYRPLLRLLKKIEDPAVTKILPVDNCISSLHHRHNVYAIYPSLVYHQVGPSQISAKSMRKLWQGQPIYHHRRKG
jgi:GR25 family glycosyltransferase involved in LPS biosynthesis